VKNVLSGSIIKQTRYLGNFAICHQIRVFTSIFDLFYLLTSYKPVLRTGSITYSIKKIFKRRDVKTTEHYDSS